MSNSEELPRREPAVGRLALLLSAYAPVALIVGFRLWPGLDAYICVGIGLLGLVTWAAFLAWLPHTQPRQAEVGNVMLIDGEVTAYVAALLIPIVAAGSADAGDLVAYGVCALLILVVGYAADLGAVNPVVYLFGLRVARAEIQGVTTTMLVKTPPVSGSTVTLARKIGVVRMVDTAVQKTGVT